MTPGTSRPYGRTRTDKDLNPGFDNHPEQRPAAVLAPIIKRVSGWTMFLCAPFYELVEWAEPKEGRLCVWSGGS